ncbi:MAG: class II aldolase/adducin family protein, partial [Clostridia bacterium]|nr:class II aldolase/adducin family protein [Clostridia bacterium]
MNEQAARAQVIRAGLELVESGLIARTWGNVSCRVDENTFVVTPSGRAYETLAPAQIVSCRIADASWEGDVKPSSEKGIHALVYRMRPDVNFVIHTHQSMASAVGAAGFAVMPPMGEPLLGEGVPVAAYGLPGTKKLRKGVGAALGGCTGKAVLMAHHGALCIGSNYDEAFAAARRLEEASEKFIEAQYLKKSGAETFDEARMLRFYLSLVARGSAPELPAKETTLYSSVRSPGGFELIEDSGRRTQHLFGDAGLSPQAQIHRQIYLRRGDVNFICQASGSGLTAVSLTG